MSNAGGVVVAGDGLAYVADSGNNRIDVFGADGAFIRNIGKFVNPPEECKKDVPCDGDKGRGVAGALSSPSDLALDSEKNIYVADSGNGRISVFSFDGVFLRAFGRGVNPSGGDVCTTVTGCQGGAEAGGPAALSFPVGVGIDSAGAVYVADTGNSRVDVFSASGTYVRSIGKEWGTSVPECKKDQPCPKDTEGEAAGALKSPFDVAVDAGGQVAVADFDNNRIDIFAPDGAFVRAFGQAVAPSGANVCTAGSGCREGSKGGGAGGLSSPTAIALSASGSLYVADANNHRVDEFGFDGAFSRAFGIGVVDGTNAFQICTTSSGCKAGISGTAPGAVANPSGVGTDCTGAIYAVETYQAFKDAPVSTRVERFGEASAGTPPCLPPAPPPSTSLEPERPAAPPPPVPLQADLIPPPPAPPRVFMKPKFTIELNSGSGTAVLIVVVADPGALLLKGKEIRTVKRRTKRAGSIELLIQPTGEALRSLQETGKAKVKVSLTFKPDKGPSIIQAKSVKLKMAERF